MLQSAQLIDHNTARLPYSFREVLGFYEVKLIKCIYINLALKSVIHVSKRLATIRQLLQGFKNQTYDIYLVVIHLAKIQSIDC